MRALLAEIQEIQEVTYYGRVVSVQGLMVEIAGPLHAMSVGSRVEITARGGRQILAEVVGFRSDRALCLPFGSLEGIGVGAHAAIHENVPAVHPSPAWLGRVINAMGEPIDRKSTRLNSSHSQQSRMPSSA